MGTASQFEVYKDILIKMEIIELSESLKVAGLTSEGLPGFQNIEVYHENFKPLMADRHTPYTEIGISSNIPRSGFYTFGCQVDSIDGLPDGLIGLDTGLKRFASLTFRVQPGGNLVGGDKPGDGMNMASEYLKNVWIPKNKDMIYNYQFGSHCFEIKKDEIDYRITNFPMAGLENSYSLSYWIEVYKVNIQDDPEMCFYVPLRESHFSPLKKNGKVFKGYKYHCQHQAEDFARTILPVPEDYPLQKGLSEDFREQFASLCDLAKNIYMDMAKAPESYGLMLVDIDSTDNDLIRNGSLTIHRFMDTLNALFSAGELRNHQLAVSAEAFRTLIKKNRPAVSGSVTRYELLISRLSDFGFVFSEFDGKPFGKKVDFFTVDYPDNPEMMDTINTYIACWEAMCENRTDVKIAPKQFQHKYYRFDYKVTADRSAVPMLRWVIDDAEKYWFSPELKAFALAFYEYSLKYEGIKFDGDYYYKSKRIAQITARGYNDLGKQDFKLSIKLTQPDKSMDVIRAASSSIQKRFMRDICLDNCGRPVDKPCKHWLHWTFEGIAHTGCPWGCFFFDDFNLELVSAYWKMLELQYGLIKFDETL